MKKERDREQGRNGSNVRKRKMTTGKSEKKNLFNNNNFGTEVSKNTTSKTKNLPPNN